MLSTNSAWFCRSISQLSNTWNIISELWTLLLWDSPTYPFINSISLWISSILKANSSISKEVCSASEACELVASAMAFIVWRTFSIEFLAFFEVVVRPPTIFSIRLLSSCMPTITALKVFKTPWKRFWTCPKREIWSLLPISSIWDRSPEPTASSSANNVSMPEWVSFFAR